MGTIRVITICGSILSDHIWYK